MAEAERYDYDIDPESDSTAARVLRLVGREKTVLELGTAAGVMTKALKTHSKCRITGVEIDPDMARLAAPYCERMIVGDLELVDLPADLAGSRFDVVVAADVLEHLHDPARILRQASSLLNDDGYLVVSVPNIAHNGVIAALLNGCFPYRDKGLLDRTHLRFFTRSGLDDLLLGNGFLPVAWEANRVAEWQSELSLYWQALPEALRVPLASNPEGQVYQYIVKAIPVREPALLAKQLDDIVRLTALLGDRERELDSQRRQTEKLEKELEEARGFIERGEADHQYLLDEVARLREVEARLSRRMEVRVGGLLRRLLRRIVKPS